MTGKRSRVRKRRRLLRHKRRTKQGTAASRSQCTGEDGRSVRARTPVVYGRGRPYLRRIKVSSMATVTEEPKTAKGIQVTDKAIAKIRAAMEKEGISPEQG